MAEIYESGHKKIHRDMVRDAIRALNIAKKRCPVDSGRLRASLTVADSEGIIQKPGNEAKPGDAVSVPDKDFTVSIGTNVFYGPHVEFGTEDQRAQPFLRPAIDEVVRGQ